MLLVLWILLILLLVPNSVKTDSPSPEALPSLPLLPPQNNSFNTKCVLLVDTVSVCTSGGLCLPSAGTWAVCTSTAPESWFSFTLPNNQDALH